MNKQYFRQRITAGRGVAALIALLALLISMSSMSALAQSKDGGKPLLATRPAGAQYFQDIAPGSFWYQYTAILYTQGIVSGYPCGTPPAGQCVPPNNLPYYIQAASVTRGEMSRYIVQARSRPGIYISGDNGLDSITVQHQSSYYGITATNTFTQGVGLYGENAGYGGTRDGLSSMGEGVYGYSSALTESVGVGAYSVNYTSLWTDLARPSAYYGIFAQNGGAQFGDQFNVSRNSVFIRGNLIVEGSKGGYVVDIMRNTGSTDLHPGEVVAAAGMVAATAQLGEIPVASVAMSGKAYDSGVLGVVDQKWIPGDPNAAMAAKARSGYYDTEATVIRPGEYMSVVTLGAYKAVKVDASNGPIRVGDLLTTSGTTAGAAMAVKDKSAAFGAVVGKALGELNSGSGMIPLMVTLK